MNDPLDIDFDPEGKRELIYIVFGTLVVAVSIYLERILFLEKSDWFQSSGALLVVIGAICESKYIEKVIAPNKGIIGEPLNFRQKFVMHSGFIMALLGTLIWGYGDLINVT